MKAKEVIKRLGISRVTLCTYVKKGYITVTKLPNGYYDYNKESVDKLAGKPNKRYNLIYCRVSTNKQKKDLETQIAYVQEFCNKNNIFIKTVYQDINSGVDLERPQFSSLLDEVLNNNVDNVYISYRDRISRLSFATLEAIFKKMGTNIMVVSDILNKTTKTDDEEFFEDLLSLMHHFSTKLYSHRRGKQN